MELYVLFGSFMVLLLMGTPVAFCLGISSFATIAYLGLPPVVVFQRLNSGVSVFALMAIPFFIFAGDLMVRGDIARRLVALAGAFVGHFRGGAGAGQRTVFSDVRWCVRLCGGRCLCRGRPNGSANEGTRIRC